MKKGESQAYGTAIKVPALELDEPVRMEITSRLNQLLADTLTIRDLYKKSHWQVAGRTLYQLHLGTMDLVISQVLRTNERQVWFLSGHLVNSTPVDQGGRPRS